jgi:hypothetical protein
MRWLRWATGLVLMMTAGQAGADVFQERTVTVTEEGREIEFRYRVLRPAAIEPGAK